MYTACCISNSDNTCSGFDTEEQVKEYVLRYCCSMCKEEGMDSACAAEWLVILDEDYAHAEHLGDIFKAAGFKVDYEIRR